MKINFCFLLSFATVVMANNHQNNNQNNNNQNQNQNNNQNNNNNNNNQNNNNNNNNNNQNNNNNNNNNHNIEDHPDCSAKGLGVSIAECFGGNWGACIGNNCNYNIKIPGDSCESIRNELCSKGVPNCCCGSDIIADVECNMLAYTGEACNIDCSAGNMGSMEGEEMEGNMTAPAEGAMGEEGSMGCGALGAAVGSCYATSWMSCNDNGNHCQNHENINTNGSCESVVSEVCALGIPSCCCGDQLLDVIQCDYKQNHGGESCDINCGGTDGSMMEGSMGCGALGGKVGACYATSWMSCNDNGNHCQNHQNVNTEGTCEEVNTEVCALGLADCCCGQDLLNVVACDYAQNHGGETCEISCDGVTSVTASLEATSGASKMQEMAMAAAVIGALAL